LASGAIIAAVVERAKEFAIKRSIELKRESPITMQDLLQALEKEYRKMICSRPAISLRTG